MKDYKEFLQGYPGAPKRLNRLKFVNKEFDLHIQGMSQRSLVDRYFPIFQKYNKVKNKPMSLAGLCKAIKKFKNETQKAEREALANAQEDEQDT